jgi:spore coat protein U-like protein
MRLLRFNLILHHGLKRGGEHMRAYSAGINMRAHWRGDISKARRLVPATIIALALLPAIDGTAAAATAVGAFSVSLVIQSACEVASTHARDFRIAVQCTHPTPYQVGLDGSPSGTGVSTRMMTSGVAAVSYDLPAAAIATVRTNAVTGSENAPDQPMAPPVTHADTVTVTITY